MAAHFNWASQTVRVFLHKWEKFGVVLHSNENVL
ncbi:hypothetical protein QUA56_22765 [Microcoleus sp. N3A4]